ncbi:hypothetical protein H9P43_002000 [Blastocladiella emersonii ATCC 22665]|nr:hypothetical protein H9P43_002000 [Blastocladiella emersonii ATCC 22665]
MEHEYSQDVDPTELSIFPFTPKPLTLTLKYREVPVEAGSDAPPRKLAYFDEFSPDFAADATGLEADLEAMVAFYANLSVAPKPAAEPMPPPAALPRKGVRTMASSSSNKGKGKGRPASTALPPATTDPKRQKTTTEAPVFASQGGRSSPMDVDPEERHTYESFLAELNKDPSGLVKLDAQPTDPFPTARYQYATELVYSDQVTPPDLTAVVSCDCRKGETCVAPPPYKLTKGGRGNGPGKRPPIATCSHSDNEPASYTADGLLQELVQTRVDAPDAVKSFEVIECNKNCLCDMRCPNRVSQRGVQFELIVRHVPGKGLGVFAGSDIPKGAFVAEYLGEVLNEEQVEARCEVGMTYFFDMDFYTASLPDEEREEMAQSMPPLAIDARYCGSVARFFNHSCSPNLCVGVIRYDTLNPNFHRIGFYARKDVRKGDELTFDYQGGGDAAAAKSAAPQRRGNRRRRGGGKSAGAKRPGSRSSSRNAATPSPTNMGGASEGDTASGGSFQSFACECRSTNCRGTIFQ